MNLHCPRSTVDISPICQQSKIGKKLPAALYVHISAINHLDRQLQDYEEQARALLPLEYTFTLIKFSYDQPKISYLLYPDFDSDAHPALHTSIQVNLELGTTQQRDYSTSNNPPILHRKKTFVTVNYPKYQEFAELTRQEEMIALLKDTSTICTRNGWQQWLQDLNVKIEGHQVITQTKF
jgi:DNA phosphorothioation-associated putative methyltransferase